MQLLPPALRDKPPESIEWHGLPCPKCGAKEFAHHGDPIKGQLLYVCSKCSHSETKLTEGTTVDDTGEDGEETAYAESFMKLQDFIYSELAARHPDMFEDPTVDRLLELVDTNIYNHYKDPQHSIGEFKEYCKSMWKDTIYGKIFQAWQAAQDEKVKFTMDYYKQWITK